MDEVSEAVRPLTPVRVGLSAIVGLIALLVLPANVCAAWIAGAFAVEAWCWFASSRQSAGLPVSRAARTNFVLSYVAGNLWWLLLAALFWSAGTVTGHTASLVLGLVVISTSVLVFHNVPAVFLVAGCTPAISALVLIGLDEGRSWQELTPTWAMLALGMVFSLGRAIDTPSAQASRRRLDASLRDYEILTETVTDVITRTSLDGIFQYISPASLPVLGYRPDELVGRPRRDIVDPESLTPGRAALARILADPTRSEVITSRVRHKDGHWLWLRTSAKALCEDGVPVAIIDVSHDVTEQLAADAALREAKAEAEAATRAKAEFLANVSHEIRTPMNGVLGALHLLERENISAEGRELMRQAGDCGRMLSQLLNDVLDFSKIEAGQLDLSPEPMDAGEALEAVGALLAPQARAKGVELRWEVSGPDLWVEADPLRVRQAMFNLIGNAVKFTAKGHVVARLAVGPSADGRRQLRFEVEDTGIGITPEEQAHLFERFRQAERDTSRRFGGAGLGLAITRVLAHMMGGEIGLTSALGEGSTFWMTFDAPAARPVSSEPIEAGLLNGVHILLVEDNPTNRLIACTMLTRLGASVEQAEDGLKGLEAARCGIHDLILMDVQMPHMDGIEATRAIRGLLGPVARTPIIGLTANVMVHQQAEYRAAGMDGVVAKPITPAALLKEISRVIAATDEPLAAAG
jgi:PAS domain S-box-containing protein